MRSNNHKEFILAPIEKILEETVTACIGVGYGIETQSLSEYVLQTAFLKMTGASEQKLKCICWDIATNDYDYRYIYLKKNYGECSRYEDKNSIYKDLNNAIKKVNEYYSFTMLLNDIDITGKIEEHIDNIIKKAIRNQEKKKKRPLSDDEKTKMSKGMHDYYIKKGLCDEEKENLRKDILLDTIQRRIDDIIDHSLLVIWRQHDYINYKNKWNHIMHSQFATNELFDKNMQLHYEKIVYKHRNRCAHNLTSYQNNLPTLKTLMGEDYDTENYFFRFAILILIDEIFMRLYKQYIVDLENTII